MENESNISLGGNSFYSLSFRKTYFLGKKLIEWILLHSQSFYKISLLQKNGKPKEISRYILKCLNELKMCVRREGWGKKLLLVSNILHCTKKT